MTGSTHLLLANPSAGTGHDLAERAARRLGDAEVVRLGPGLDLAAAVRAAVEAGRVVVAVGGDGTVNAVAEHVVSEGGTLGVLPGGTLNHFARDLGVRDEADAVEALVRGHERSVDVARAGGRVVVNNAAMGLYPEIVEERAEPKGRLARAVATAVAGARVLGRARPLLGTISADADRRLLSAWTVFVGVNRYLTRPGRLGERERLDEGVLDVRVLMIRGRGARSSLAWGVARGHAWPRRRMVATLASRVDISLEGSARAVARDGETDPRVRSLTVEIVPGALRVVGPAPRPGR